MPSKGDQLREEFYAALAAERAERARALAEERAERRAALRRIEEVLERVSVKMEEVGRQWGHYTDGEGRQLEDEGLAALGALATLGTLAVDPSRTTLRLAAAGREYDGLLYSPAARVLVECKRRLRKGDVVKFATAQLTQFLEDFPELVNGRALYGVVAGASVDAAAAAEAKRRGLFVVRIPARRAAEVLNAAGRPQANGRGRTGK